MCGNAITPGTNAQRHTVPTVTTIRQKSAALEIPSGSKRPLIAVIVMFVSMLFVMLNSWGIFMSFMSFRVHTTTNSLALLFQNVRHIISVRSFSRFFEFTFSSALWIPMLLLPTILFVVITLFPIKKKILCLTILLTVYVLTALLWAGLPLVVFPIPIIVLIFLCIGVAGVKINRKISAGVLIVIIVAAFIYLIRILPHMGFNNEIDFLDKALAGNFIMSSIAYFIILQGAVTSQYKKDIPEYTHTPLTNDTGVTLSQAVAAPASYENNAEEKTAEWYQAEIARLESLQNEKVWYLAIGGIVLGIAVFALFNFIGNVTNINFINIGAIGILLIIGGVGVIPFNMYTKKKRTEMINELKNELAALLYSNQNKNP